MSNIATALSGLQNVSQAIDTVSNNIANANTIGYKSGEYVFATQFLNGSNSSDQPATGQGSQTLGVRRAMTQGAITNSANPLDLAISGKGMFRLLQGSGSAETVDPSAVYYSRNGQFGVDKSGYIVNENGMYLTGYQPTVDGNQMTDDLIKNNGLLRMPDSNLPGNATTYSTLSAMLDSTSTAFTKTANVSFDPTQATYNNKTTQTVFDNSGNSHTLEVYYRRINDSTLSITSGATGYTYTPSTAASPNTLGTTSVTLNSETVLRVNTAPVASTLASATSAGTTVSLTAAPSNAGTAVTVTEGMKVFINGVDSGVTVAAGGYTAGATSLTTSAAVTVPSGASVSFYLSDLKPTVTAAANASLLTSVSSVAGLAVGDKVYLSNIDTGATITAIGDTTVTLSKSISTGALSGVTTVTFKRPLSMTLITPEGTEIPVTGATNKKTSGEILTTTTSQVEVYASIDGKFYDYQDSSTFSSRAANPETQGANGTGYKTVAKLSFMGGQNIDSVVKDSLSGDPMFKTTTKLTSRLANQAGGSSDLILDLDLSGTQLHAGAFQMTKSIQNGEPVSRLTKVTVDNEGRIVGVYGTGKQQFIGQVAMVSFDNEEGLIPVGKNAFAASNMTGTEKDGTGVTVGRAGTGVLGEIRSQALEASNVDLANELVRLMILQRSYSANSQSLKAVDQTLRDTLQMVG
ncbi:MAG: flagellar hook-basal body complex protein [Burkholderiales bacterium]|nr:flagellar hook-basal body complex protein [Burkholderiales bacterium]